jgi:hypothetical protein
VSGVLQKADGTTYTKAALIAAATTDTVTYYTLDQDVYWVRRYVNAQGSTADEKTLKWAAGTRVPSADLDVAYPAATFTSITPATGPAAGGTATVIRGTNLRGVSGVTIGGVAGTAFSVISDTEIHVTTGAHAAGVVNVVLADDAGPVTATGAYTYV